MTTRILVVDDDPSLIQMMTEDLEQEGYVVLSGYDGQMAIHLAKTQHPNLIIMDVNMPMTNGLVAMENIRHNELTKNIPIILLTGETSDIVFPKVKDTDRVAHIKKPIDLQDLNYMVKQFIQKYPTT
jgi:CheY-like chemotaxis protein